MKSNNSMIKLLDKMSIDNKIILTKELIILVEKGFLEENGCFFLRNLINDPIIKIKDYIDSIPNQFFIDKTGYECFKNKIHIDDYVKNNYLYNSLLFSLEIIKQYNNNKKLRFIIGLEEHSCTVRFHKIRKNENWINNDLESYNKDAILVFDSNEQENIKSLLHITF